MKNIHILPTDKPSRLYKQTGALSLDTISDTSKDGISINQHIYITSDEKIKEGDWFIRNGSIHKCFRVYETDIEFLTSIDSVYCGSNTFWRKEFCKKIILTTDQSLDGVQEIDDEFLEWFVKNTNCEEVEVLRCPIEGLYTIIPKEEAKREFVNNTSKWNLEDFEEPKQELTVEEITELVFCNKQETLEEAALANDKYLLKEVLDPGFCYNVFSFKEGAKWQMKRMYSEEDLKIAFTEGHNSARLKGSYKFNGTFEEDWNEWFEQFKKK